jgi:hypothetical protein
VETTAKVDRFIHRSRRPPDRAFQNQISPKPTGSNAGA